MGLLDNFKKKKKKEEEYSSLTLDEIDKKRREENRKADDYAKQKRNEYLESHNKIMTSTGNDLMSWYIKQLQESFDAEYGKTYKKVQDYINLKKSNSDINSIDMKELYIKYDNFIKYLQQDFKKSGFPPVDVTYSDFLLPFLIEKLC